MLSPKDFLLSLGALPCSAAHDAMQIYAEYVAKEIRHTAAEIALTVGDTRTHEEAHRDIMNLQINHNAGKHNYS